MNNKKRKLIMQHFLVYSGPGIGDITLSLTVAKRLKESMPDCVVDMYIRSSNKKIGVANEIMKYQKYIESLYYYNPKEIVHSVYTWIKMKKKNYKYIFLCKHLTEDESKMPLIFAKLLGGITVGPCNQKSCLDYDEKINIPENAHVVESFCMLLKPLKVSTDVDVHVFDVDSIKSYESKYDEYINYESEYIVLCVGTGKVGYKNKGKKYLLSSKEWDKEKWIELAYRLSSNNKKCILLGERLDIDFQDKNILNLTGKTTIGDSLKLILNSRLVVGADTGMMHCAAALDVTTNSLFGMTKPYEYAPYSDSNYVIEDENSKRCYCFGKIESIRCQSNMCMKNISVEQVLEQVMKITDGI